MSILKKVTAGVWLWVMLVPLTAAAVKFTPLSGNLPLIGNAWHQNGIQGFLNGLLGISVAVAAILAVVMLAIGGFKYMTTDSAFKMGDAKEQIANAIIGLLIVLTSILLLSTINADIVSLRIFQPPAV